MSGTAFRAWFGNAEASADDLARIEEIEVTQEIDKFWEARVRTSICLDAQGRWQHGPDAVAKAPFTRMRVEIDPGNGSFVPLIDGPISNFESRLDSQPGRSSATFVVRDDSVFLDRDEDTEVFRDLKHSEIAEQVMRRIEQIAETRVDPPTTATYPAVTRRGTLLMLLVRLARANARRVYVLPGATPGKSIGCFLPDPEQPDAALPPLRLIGDDRNLGDATITEDSEAPERSRGSVLRLADGSLASFEANAADLRIDGDRPAVPAEQTAKRLLAPADALADELTEAATARARESACAYRLSANVIAGCFGAVLTPGVKVRVECGSTPYSGNYLITKVVHRITPSLYSQSFEAKSDGSTEVAAAPVAEAPGGGLSVSFSASVGVF